MIRRNGSLPGMTAIAVAAAVFAAAIFATSVARAQDFPTRVVRVVVPFSPGGAGVFVIALKTLAAIVVLPGQVLKE